MKRILILLLTVLLCMGLLAACGNEAAPAGSGDSDATQGADTTVHVETFDAGNVSSVVPEGWKAFPQKDVFSDGNNPDSFFVGKGAESELDLFSKPYILITHYAPATTMIPPSKDFYDDAVDLDDVTIGERTWHAFSCSSIGYKYIMLWTGESDADQFQVSFLYEGNGTTLTLDDPDVQMIIAGIAVSE